MEKKNTRNRREKIIGFIYVSVLFITATLACCFFLFYYSEGKTGTRKEFVISKMDRIREFQALQSQQLIVVDSIYRKIKAFDPGVNASYEESDIKFYLNDIRRLYDDHNYDGRYKIFNQLPNFYNMWFADRKEYWSKQQNIIRFRRNLEECEIGLQKKNDELKNRKK
ncbi:type VI secretion system transmembrane protein TssO [Bacteroides sp. 224]|uniref:type VI secretion system transmembrane protein TssO n=1 Tax=Bacteroides sp. 224 TaxID=2302936 RepID=UPI0013D812DE|nr:type VI secretion system transmembrane protein TssO [Bacteroides sp. 224]NDV65224.1 type VI secretion system transmembrane protein TssO [Bacteroides sp. 224]